MDFEWDPAKRETNLDKHGVDFLIATQVLTEPHLVIRTDQQPEPRLEGHRSVARRTRPR
ncbi:BrnT family toxin [Salinibacter sp.]|uniref:BrnT family toxin n=1 Tax=Salinibacter sp. TaxID=2065818 RepID=UPI002342C922